jgi:hypothetical protein
VGAIASAYLDGSADGVISPGTGTLLKKLCIESKQHDLTGDKNRPKSYITYCISGWWVDLSGEFLYFGSDFFMAIRRMIPHVRSGSPRRSVQISIVVREGSILWRRVQSNAII